MFPKFGIGRISQSQATGVTDGDAFVAQTLKCPRCGSAGLDPNGPGAIVALNCRGCGQTIPIAEFKEQTRSKYVACDLADHPDYAAALGRVAATSSQVEQKLCVIAGFLLQAPPWHAHTAFYAIANNKARIDMVKALATHMLGDAAFRPALTALLDKARRLAEKRNRYIHARWAESLDKKHVYLLENPGLPSAAEYRRVKLSELQATAAETSALTKDLGEFAGDYSAAFPIQNLDSTSIPESLRRKLSPLLPRQSRKTSRRQSRRQAHPRRPESFCR